MTTAVSTSTVQAASHSRAYVESILAQLERLPTLSPVAMRLLRATAADDTSARDLVSIIKGDASLTAALLRALHRADLGVRRDVTDIERAVTLLGFTAVRNVVLTVSVFEALTGSDQAPSAVTRRNALWTHNLGVACAAEALAVAGVTSVSASEAFIGGLLHDVGKIALEACFPKSYARVIERVERQHCCICSAEQDVFGLDHTVAGKRLLSHWGVGPSIIECAWLHHEPMDAVPSGVSHPELIAVVHLADGLVRQHGVGFSGYAGFVNLGNTAAHLGISEEALAKAMRQLPTRIAPLSGVMGLGDVSEVLSIDALLSANRQLGAVNAELAETNRGLERRSRLLECVEQFIREAAEARTLGALCASGAQATLQAMGADSVAVIAPDGAGGLTHIGLAWADRAEPTHQSIEHDRVAALVSGDLIGTANDPPAWLPVPDRMVETLRAAAPEWDADASSCRMVPLVSGGAMAGVAIAAWATSSTLGANDRRGECAALSQVLGQAVHSMRARASAERMTEQLVDVNRRFRQAQTETIRGKSVSMIAKMADGAAHELNNPLSVISGRAQLALKDCQDADLRRALEIIIEQTNKAAGIATELMEFAKPEPPRPQPHGLGVMLESLCQHWREGFRVSAEQLSLKLADPGATAFADGGQLQRALEAVVENAAQAGAGPDHHVEINSPSRSSDETVRLMIRDNGCGMSREVLEHAIDPFYSHRPAGRGRGLGLSQAHRLVELNGGRLWIESIPNLGTTVTIELPSRAPQG